MTCPVAPKGGLLSGTDGRDHLDGKDGDDEIFGFWRYLRDRRRCQAAMSSTVVRATTAWLSGDDGDDVIYGGDGHDIFLWGAKGEDVLYGGKGNDSVRR